MLFSLGFFIGELAGEVSSLLPMSDCYTPIAPSRGGRVSMFSLRLLLVESLGCGSGGVQLISRLAVSAWRVLLEPAPSWAVCIALVDG